MMFEEIVQKRQEEGRIEGLIETAKNLFDLNLTPEQIAKATSLPLEQVLQLQKGVMSPIAK